MDYASELGVGLITNDQEIVKFANKSEVFCQPRASDSKHDSE